MKIFTDAQTVRTQIDGFRGLPGRDGRDGKDGRNGADGAPGKNGYTPQKGVDYFDGAPGKDGQDGAQGEKGVDGVSPIVTLAREEDGVRIGVRDAEGEKSAKVYDGANGEGGSGTWSLIINQRITEDCVAVAFDTGDNGEVLTEYDDLIVFIDLCANAGDFTSGVKVSFTPKLSAWGGGYVTRISGQKLSEFTGRNIHALRFEKTGAGVLPTVEWNAINTGNVAQTLYLSSGANTGSHVNFNTPFAVGGPDALDYETISTAAEFECIKVGGYQAVMGAGSVIKVWGHKA